MVIVQQFFQLCLETLHLTYTSLIHVNIRRQIYMVINLIFVLASQRGLFRHYFLPNALFKMQPVIKTPSFKP